MKPEERANIIKTLNGLSEMISALQTEIVALQRPTAVVPAANKDNNNSSSSSSNNNQSKNKTDVRASLPQG